MTTVFRTMFLTLKNFCMFFKIWKLIRQSYVYFYWCISTVGSIDSDVFSWFLRQIHFWGHFFEVRVLIANKNIDKHATNTISIKNFGLDLFYFYVSTCYVSFIELFSVIIENMIKQYLSNNTMSGCFFSRVYGYFLHTGMQDKLHLNQHQHEPSSLVLTSQNSRLFSALSSPTTKIWRLCLICQ